MELEWTSDINNCDNYCKFFEFQDLIYFPCNCRYSNRKNSISVYRFNVNGDYKKECFYYEPYDIVARGQDWRIFINNEKIYLSCGKDREVFKSTRFYRDKCDSLQQEFHQEEKKQVDLFLDITEKIIRIKPTESMLSDYRCLSTVISEEKSVSFGDYELMLYGSCGYQCISKKNGKILWKNKHQGYRYTDFELKDDKLLFGTAGFGGRLYCYNINNGDVICNINTHGTSDYIWHEDKIFCRGADGSLILVDPYNNKIVNSFKLRGQILHQSTFSIINNRLYTLTNDIRTNMTFVNCLSLN